jgi:HAL2 family 3'(2'),5'-bisphosphate nucleotidase
LLPRGHASAARVTDLERQTLELARQSLPGLEAEELRSLLDRTTATPGTADRWWVLDPIDGTKGFLRGDQYAVALALVAGRQVVLGVLGCPQLPSRGTNAEKGCMLWAVRGGGAWQSGLAGSEVERIRVDGVSDPGAATVVEPVEQGHYDPELVGRILARLGVAGAAQRVDSQCKYALVARGDASAYLRLVREATAENVWDHAAGALVVEEAGGG